MKSGVRMLMASMLLLITGFAQAQTGTTRVVGGVTYQVHKVVSGETLYKIAKKYGCTVQQLQAANKGGETLKIGQELLVPTKPGTQVAAVKKTTAVSNTKQHSVVKGETLSKIARQYNTTVEELKSLNNLSSEGIRIGQVLKVPAAANETVVATETGPAEVVTNTEAAPENTQEVVEAKPERTVEPEKPIEIKRPAGPRQVVATEAKPAETKTNNSDRGGMPLNTEAVLAETATEKEENAMARVVDEKLDQTRTFVVHPSLPKGSIIVVINETTGKMAYCRVVDNVKLNDLNGANLGITKAVADKIGLKESQGSVKIKYAAP